MSYNSMPNGRLVVALVFLFHLVVGKTINMIVRAVKPFFSPGPLYHYHPRGSGRTLQPRSAGSSPPDREKPCLRPLH